MGPFSVRKTTKIVNLWIIIEQVIHQLKCFRILANEMAINQLQYIDDMLKVWAVLSNF